MSALSPVGTQSWLERGWECTTDLLTATALIWAIPLVLGLAVALINLIPH